MNMYGIGTQRDVAAAACADQLREYNQFITLEAKPYQQEASSSTDCLGQADLGEKDKTQQ